MNYELSTTWIKPISFRICIWAPLHMHQIQDLPTKLLLKQRIQRFHVMATVTTIMTSLSFQVLIEILLFRVTLHIPFYFYGRISRTPRSELHLLPTILLAESTCCVEYPTSRVKSSLLSYHESRYIICSFMY